jgi:hypothetical protein
VAVGADLCQDWAAGDVGDGHSFGREEAVQPLADEVGGDPAVVAFEWVTDPAEQSPDSSVIKGLGHDAREPHDAR